MTINKSTNPVDIIETTQKMRLRIIEELTKSDDGLYIPTDAKEVGVLAQILRDLDAAALTTRKLDVDEKQIDMASKASANVAAVLKSMGGGNPFLNQGVVIEGHVIPKPDAALLPAIELVPGHTKQGADELNYVEFVVDDNHQ